MNKALESPNLSFDFRSNRLERFSNMGSSNNSGNEILKNIINTDPKDLSQWRRLTHKPLKTVTLKGPSFGPNGRTFKIWHPENWEWIQHQRADFGARERLEKQAEESIKKNFDPYKRSLLEDLTKVRNEQIHHNIYPKIVEDWYKNNPEAAKILLDLDKIGYSRKVIPTNNNIIINPDYYNNAAYEPKGYFIHGNDERLLTEPYTRAH